LLNIGYRKPSSDLPCDIQALERHALLPKVWHVLRIRDTILPSVR